MSLWYEKKGPEEDVVISSRVRLARNLINYPFPSSYDANSANAVVNDIKNAVNVIPKSFDLKFIDFKDYSPNDLSYLVEKHLISKEMAAMNVPRGIVVNNDESLSVMVNEEDHLRIQSLLPGLQFEVSYKMCNDFEERLNKYVSYAFDETLGYLTTCPTNIGTGLRVSAMMFLPMLASSGSMNKILEALAKFGVTIRGVYGENSEARGYIFQISNQTSLGQSEEDIIENMGNIIKQIVEQERTIRNEYFNNNKDAFVDKIYRSYGVLANARSISCSEAMELLAPVRIGVNLGVLQYIDIVELNRLIVDVQPSSIMNKIGENATQQQRDAKRAEIIRDVMNKKLNN